MCFPRAHITNPNIRNYDIRNWILIHLYDVSIISAILIEEKWLTKITQRMRYVLNQTWELQHNVRKWSEN